ncbi:hypothetical protein LXT21_40765 [Myxococcus sp. K38C18041901]|uniref:hypothetical protein n=1 Tax=Myxococcus guangdongensis TaxID=2906760 RepID=UPI0020A747B4|nr:hypothetical protein [Myxococcus guangdongensis]MCP3065124.1 hypothetical protein [Myxococcus guangdongensis]
MYRRIWWLALLSVLTSLACVEDRSAAASSLAVRVPTEQPLKLKPGQEGSLVVQAMNEDSYAADDVEVRFLVLDPARFEFVDVGHPSDTTVITAFDKDSGLRGAARIKFKVKDDALYGTAGIAASLTRTEQLADASTPPSVPLSQLTVEVVPDLAKVKLTPLPSTPIELDSGSTDLTSLAVQATDEKDQPINGVELYAEVFGGVDSPVTLVKGEASQPRDLQQTEARTVNGLRVSGVAQWAVRAKGPVAQPTNAQVRFGLARSGGESSVSQLGRFDLHVLPAEEPTP